VKPVGTVAVESEPAASELEDAEVAVAPSPPKERGATPESWVSQMSGGRSCEK
jgi:hypothetical protein